MTSINAAWRARGAAKRRRAHLVATTGTRCHYCGVQTTPPHEQLPTSMRVDHVVPTHRGGSNDISNLVVCCNACNTSKSTRDVVEWSVMQCCAGLRDFGQRMALACVDRWRAGA